jgi:hypothetical protein
MPEPLYKEDLKDLKCPCGRPGCEDPLFFHSQCHPAAPTWTSYFDGVLTISCVVCDKIIAQIAVASRESGH